MEVKKKAGLPSGFFYKKNKSEHKNIKKMAQCISPFYKKETGLSFPCGKCYPCKARRVSGWSFRLMQEAKRSDSALFITLTYNNDTVPITSKGYMTLNKRDVQLFLKRLRIYSVRSKKTRALPKASSLLSKNNKQKTPQKNNKKQILKTKIKYYLAGEYGGKTDRPHYHIILFNSNFDDVEATWLKGDVHYGELSEASAAYTLKYISKDTRIPLHKNDDRQPEFSLMSKGLGSNYLTPQIISYHKKALVERFYLTVPGGHKIAIPRYYKKKIYTDLQLQLIGYQIGENAIKNYAEKNYEEKLDFLKREEQLTSYYASINKESRTTVL